MAYNRAGSKKSFPVFDCDSHIVEPDEIWDKYVPADQREFIKSQFYFPSFDKNWEMCINGVKIPLDPRAYSYPEESWHPGLSREAQGSTPPSSPDWDEKVGRAALVRDPHARLRAMDACGIDQVMVFPSHFVMLCTLKNAEAAQILCRAYNDWVFDYCSVSPDRLFPAGLLPTQNTDYAIEELRRVAKMGFKAGLVRPVICNDRYPTFPEFDPLWREFEELGLTLGMHTFIPGGEPMTESIGARIAAQGAATLGADELKPTQLNEFMGGPTSLVYTPAQWVDNILRCMGSTQSGLEAMSFVMEAMNWTMVVLLSGWLEKFPKLKVAILESNATWLPLVLEKAEGYLELDKWMRDTATPPVKTGDPREVFNSKCFISFESDEDMVFRAWDFYEDIALWSSDMPHHDGADVWDAIDAMNERGVPQEAQEKMLGGNARRLYGIEPKLYVTEAPAEYVPEKLPRYGVGAEA